MSDESGEGGSGGAERRVAPHLIPKTPPPTPRPKAEADESGGSSGRKRRRGSRGRGRGQQQGSDQQGSDRQGSDRQGSDRQGSDRQGSGRQGSGRQGSEQQGSGRQGSEQQGSGRQGSSKRGGSGQQGSGEGSGRSSGDSSNRGGSDASKRRRRRRGGRSRSGGSGKGGTPRPVDALSTFGDEDDFELDADELERRRGRTRKGRPVGRYMMAVHKHGPDSPTQVAVLEGRTLIEHHVSRPSDRVTQIHGNIYLARVQNVLPGMEAAFVDIGTPKNAVLYRSDVGYDADELDLPKGAKPRIEDMLSAGQSIVCQVTKNPIAHKGARLTMEVSIPGRFVVLVPNQGETFGISKRLPDNERKRLRSILERIRPAGHGLILRTAAEDVTEEEIERDVARLTEQWAQIDKLAAQAKAPSLLYTEPDVAVRVIREEFNRDYRAVVIDDRELYEQVSSYMKAVTPALAERVEYHDPSSESLPLFERFHVQEQLVKAVDRKVWLPSGGSLIIEHTEALTVIDVNTGKNVGTSSLEETVFRNNLEAAEEVARQLRLRDIGGIIVIDFVDMEERKHREEVVKVFREALARDKTRSQVFEISELGLVEMTRKRIGEGLLESLSSVCSECSGRGLLVDRGLLDQ